MVRFSTVKSRKLSKSQQSWAPFAHKKNTFIAQSGKIVFRIIHVKIPWIQVNVIPKYNLSTSFFNTHMCKK